MLLCCSVMYDGGAVEGQHRSLLRLEVRSTPSYPSLRCFRPPSGSPPNPCASIRCRQRMQITR